MTRKLIPLSLISLFLLQGCASSYTETDPVNIALKTCAMGLSTQTAYVFKAAYEIASKKGAAEFSSTMNQSVDTQEHALLAQLGDKSPESTKAILKEISNVRECVIAQSSMLRPASRPELLEQCRLNIQQRISPPGPVSHGTLRFWTQLPDDPKYKKDMPVMAGHFDNGGRGFDVKAQCDISGGRLQDVIDLEPTAG